jgi:ATP-dependent Clp protease protease subunit
MLLAAGAKGHRAALPSATIMLKQNISAFRGQASELEILRQEVRNTKKQLVDILAECTGKGADVVEADMSHPKYFTPYTAVEYGLIDKVLEQQGATFTRASERKVLLPNGSKAS